MDAVIDSLSPEALDRARLWALSAQSSRDDVVLVEMLYRGQWIRFDISHLEAVHVDAATLFARYFGKALTAVGIDRAPAADSSASSTSVSQE